MRKYKNNEIALLQYINLLRSFLDHVAAGEVFGMTQEELCECFDAFYSDGMIEDRPMHKVSGRWKIDVGKMRITDKGVNFLNGEL